MASFFAPPTDPSTEPETTSFTEDGVEATEATPGAEPVAKTMAKVEEAITELAALIKANPPKSIDPLKLLSDGAAITDFEARTKYVVDNAADISVALVVILGWAQSLNAREADLKAENKAFTEKNIAKNLGETLTALLDTPPPVENELAHVSQKALEQMKALSAALKDFDFILEKTTANYLAAVANAKQKLDPGA